MKLYLIVSGDFVKTGGMDRANYALAEYLANRGVETHLVAHRVDADLKSKANVIVHRVPRPLRSYLAGEPLLDRVGRHWASKLHARGSRVVVNGGNCHWGDVNWVHYVHSAYPEPLNGTILHRAKSRLHLRLSLIRESRTIRSSRIAIANSIRTKRDLVERLDVPEGQVSCVYYGIDPKLFRPATPEDKMNARRELGWLPTNRIVLFVGALGDRRKGFDILFSAWTHLCADPSWKGTLVVVGTGADVPRWISRAANRGMSSRVKFLGRRSDVPRLMTASDALVAPSRYEAYGLAVHEALCCGLPAFVTLNSGVAELYPSSLKTLITSDPDDAADLSARLRAWQAHSDHYASAVAELAANLRKRSWDDMAAEIVDLVENTVR